MNPNTREQVGTKSKVKMSGDSFKLRGKTDKLVVLPIRQTFHPLRGRLSVPNGPCWIQHKKMKENITGQGDEWAKGRLFLTAYTESGKTQ